MKTDPDFYKRMQEAKKLKRKALEQKHIRDMFGPINIVAALPERTDADLYLDEAVRKIKEKLDPPSKEDIMRQRLELAFRAIEQKAHGL